MSGYNGLINIKTFVAERRPNWVIIDCRFDIRNVEWGSAQYQSGHIPNALYAHLDDDLSGPIIHGKTGRHPLPEKNIWVNQIRHWGITSETQVVAYDQGPGMFAARLWWMMKWVGHEKVAVLNGGWEAWRNQQLPVSRKPVSTLVSAFEPEWREDMVIKAPEILKHLDHDKSRIRLIDVRDPERYRGEIEPLDPIAGHIPGAANFPFKANINVHGGWNHPNEIKDEVAKRKLTPDSDSNLIFYCGSGVTACHQLLSFYHAGLGMHQLYPGSWSEWITDKSRPIIKSHI